MILLTKQIFDVEYQRRRGTIFETHIAATNTNITYFTQYKLYKVAEFESSDEILKHKIADPIWLLLRFGEFFRSLNPNLLLK